MTSQILNSCLGGSVWKSKHCNQIWKRWCSVLEVLPLSLGPYFWEQGCMDLALPGHAGLIVLSLFPSPSDLSDLAVQTCSAVVGYKEGVRGQHYGRHEPFGSPNSVFTLRDSYGRTSGRCLIRVLNCFLVFFPVNFRIKWLLWHVHVHFDCAGSHKVCRASFACFFL